MKRFERILKVVTAPAVLVSLLALSGCQSFTPEWNCQKHHNSFCTGGVARVDAYRFILAGKIEQIGLSEAHGNTAININGPGSLTYTVNDASGDNVKSGAIDVMVRGGLFQVVLSGGKITVRTTIGDTTRQDVLSNYVDVSLTMKNDDRKFTLGDVHVDDVSVSEANRATGTGRVVFRIHQADNVCALNGQWVNDADACQQAAIAPPPRIVAKPAAPQAPVTQPVRTNTPGSQRAETVILNPVLPNGEGLLEHQIREKLRAKPAPVVPVERVLPSAVRAPAASTEQ